MTKFIDITKSFEPKKEASNTKFVYFKNDDGTWTKNISDAKSWGNVAYLGQQYYDNKMYGLFKAWATDFANATLFLGIKGDEEYKSI